MDNYPEIILVSGTGPATDDELFNYAKEALKKYNAGLVDEYYYRPPEWFRDNTDRYDNYDRNTYKIFAGEYAAQSVATTSPANKNNWECALSEAVFMTGLERNADVVHMCSCAPLFAHVDGWQWTPDLIWFNNLTSYGTANYYVQKMFSTNSGTQLIKILQDDKPLTGQNGLYASAVIDDRSEEIILKIVNITAEKQNNDIVLRVNGRVNGTANVNVLRHRNLEAVNTIISPDAIKPFEKYLGFKGKKFNFASDPYSLFCYQDKDAVKKYRCLVS